MEGKRPEQRQPRQTAPANAIILTGRGEFDTPGGGAVEGGGVTSHIVRGTKMEKKMYLCGKGGKRNGKERKVNGSEVYGSNARRLGWEVDGGDKE